MKTLLRFIGLLATIALVMLLLFGGVFLETGNLDIMATRSFLPEVGTLRTIPISHAIEQESGTESVLRFTWRGGDILHNESTIDETEFAALLEQAKTSKATIEIVKFPDVRGLDAYRWRQLLDDADVHYEIVQQER